MKNSYYGDTTPSISKTAPHDVITNTPNNPDNSNTIANGFTINIANCPSLPDKAEIICRYEKISLTIEMTKDDIRQEIIKSGIVHDIAVELYKENSGSSTVDKLEHTVKIVLYYILDP